jgi:superfamily II DNA or RNA helicase
MGAMMVASHVARGGKVSWLAHRIELVDQAAATLESFGLSVGSRGRGASAPVQVGMVQTMVRRGAAPDATLVIADECHHHGESVSWSDLLRAYLGGGAHVVGLTATPSRADGQALHGFDALVVAAQIRELQALGLLVPLKIKAPGKTLGSKYIAQSPVDAYLENARGRSAVVFAPHIKAAEDYERDFRALGVTARIVTGETDDRERADTLSQFSRGLLPVVINVMVLTEGFDAPICSCVIVGRGCGSPGLWIQMVGRGLRPSPGKRDCLLLDLRGLTHLHGRPDADREYHLDGEGITLAGGAPVTERLCKVCGCPLGAETTCPECGKEHELVTPSATGEKLVDWREVLSQDPPDKRASRLAKWMREARDKGWKPAAVMFKYKAVYGHWPDSNTRARAEGML